MLNSTVLEVAIGLIFVYFLFSTVCSAIQEAIAAWLGLRAKGLESALVRLVGPGVKDALYAHQLITGLVHEARATARPPGAIPDRAKPQYIEPRTFSRALVDVLTVGEPPTFRALEKAVRDGSTGVSQAIGALIGGPSTAAGPGATRDLAADAARLREARLAIESWYNDAMERLSGRYKRNAQAMILAIAAAVVVARNVDTMAIVDSLARNATVRASVVAMAARDAAGVPSDPGLSTTLGSITGEVAQVEGLRVPLGWSPTGTATDWPRKVTGLVLSALALTLGAPFWFDLLNRLVNVRSAGRRPDTRPEHQATPEAPAA